MLIQFFFVFTYGIFFSYYDNDNKIILMIMSQFKDTQGQGISERSDR